MSETFQQRLIELRKEKQLNQRELAKEINISQVAICRWEQGINLPNIDILYRLCKFFDVSADYLIGLTEDETPHWQEEPIAVSKANTELYAYAARGQKSGTVSLTDEQANALLDELQAAQDKHK